MGRLSRDAFPGLIPLGGSNDLFIQVGRGAFSGIYTDTVSVPIRTSLTNITAMFAQVSDTYSAATDANTAKKYQLNCDVIVASNAVNVYRSSQGQISGLPFSYLLMGTVESTD